MGGYLYFPATTDELGEELWRSDGTAGGGAELVKDIFPGVEGSEINDLTVLGSTLFFRADDGVHGAELWMSDGTPGGTMMVKDIREGGSGSFPEDLHVVNGDLLFSAFEEASGTELWIYDVSEGQARLLKDINPGDDGSMIRDTNYGTRYFCVFGGNLYFSADDGVNGTELWVSDGTELGTTLLHDNNTGSGDGCLPIMTVVGSKFFFVGNDGTAGLELWCSDGTALGTELVKDIRPGASSGSVGEMTAVGSLLFFEANDGTTGVELWVSDGTEGGTTGLDLNPGAGNFYPNDITAAGTHAVFEAFDVVGGSRVLWKSDGTAVGSTILGATGIPSTGGLTGLDSDTVLFTIFQSGVTGYELWKGTISTNTVELVKDINPGSSSSLYGQLTSMHKIGSEVFFSATDSSASNGDPEGELWKTDGTEGGTVKIAEINESPRSGEPVHMATLGNRVLFTRIGVSSFNQRLLLASDGTPDGVVEIKELSIWRRIHEIIPVGNIAYLLVANTESSIKKWELWKTNGTTAGTVQVHDDIGEYVTSGSNPPRPDNFTVMGNKLFFVTATDEEGRELWTSNGTTAGTKMVKDIRPGTSSSSPGSLVVFKDQLYFRAAISVSTSTLWRSDGTTGGTEEIPWGGLTSPDKLTVVGDTLFLIASYIPPGPNFYRDRELWKTDGTEGGTALVKDIRPGLDGSFGTHLTTVGGTLFFTASDGVNGQELWKSDGTEGGTMMVEDIVSGSDGSQPSELFEFDDSLFFVVDDGVHGPELWKSDGTPGGTDLFKDTRPGSTLGQGPQEFFLVGDHFFFRAGADAEGEELWRSDGTPEGTMSFDINVGPAGSGPTIFAHTLNRLLFSAAESATGRELWAIPVTLPVEDNRNPSQRITSKGGRVKDGNYDLSGLASDNLSVARVEVSINGGPAVDATLDAPNTKGQVPFSLDGMTLENGINQIVVTTFDLNGNASRSSTLTVNFLSNRPAVAGNYQALLLPDAIVTPSNDNTGLFALRVTSVGRFSGRVTLGKYSFPVRGTIDNDGHARFAVRGVLPTSMLPLEKELTKRVNRTLTLDFGNLAFEVDAGLVEGTLSDSQTSDLISLLGGARAHFHPRLMPVPDNYLENRGRYTAHFPAEATQSGLTAEDYPQGTGVATVRVLKSGRVLTRGVLADGTRFGNAATLSETLGYSLFAKLYRKGGALAGPVQLDDQQAETDLLGDLLLWLRPENTKAKHYPAGWSEGIDLSILGAKYVRVPGESVVPDLGADDLDGDGNAELSFSDGLLSSPIEHTLNIDARNRVWNVPATRDFSARVVAGSGLLNGVFLHEDGKRTRWQGVIHQKGSMPGGVGFFLSVVPRNAPFPGQSGSVVLLPEMEE